MGITLSSVLPYLLVAAGYVLRHYEIGSKLLSFFGLGGASPSTGTVPQLPDVLHVPAVSIKDHPVLSDAVNAAVQKAASDAANGQIVSLKEELKAVVSAAVSAAIADLKPKA